MSKGKMYVLSGPSGVGKGTVVKGLFEKYDEIFLSVSATTREKRKGEEEGVNYYYKSQTEFTDMINKGEFLEWAKFCDNYYGTPKAPVEKMLNEGKDVLLEIEIQGAMNVKKTFPESIFIFVAPPTVDDLLKRLVGRGTETEDVIVKRVETAKKELGYAKEYDYILVNDKIEKTVDDFISIITAEKLKTERCIDELEVLKQ